MILKPDTVEDLFPLAGLEKPAQYSYFGKFCDVFELRPPGIFDAGN